MPYALALDAAVAFLKRYKVFLLVGPLMLALALSHCSDKRHTRQRDEARAENAAILKASEANRAAAIAQVKATQAKYEQIAKDTDRDQKQALADARDATARYAAVHRLPAPGICRSAPASTGQSDVAQSGDGTSPTAVMVEQADLDILVGNTVRLQAVRDWAISLVDQGLGE